jgi:hypothetical protein
VYTLGAKFRLIAKIEIIDDVSTYCKPSSCATRVFAQSRRWRVDAAGTTFDRSQIHDQAGEHRQCEAR